MRKRVIGAGVGFFVLFALLWSAFTPHNNSGSSSSLPTAPSTSTATDMPLDTVTPEPDPPVAPKSVGPKMFTMPDFTDMDENEVDSWFNDNNIQVSTEFDYGDQEGTDCADAGDGIVDQQTPKQGTRLKNSMSTDVYLSVYCDY